MQLEEVKRIYLPGRGAYDIAAMQVLRAVQAYDERLSFGRNEDNGDWVVFVKMPRGSKRELVPVLGFGNKEMPTPEEVLRRVEQADTRRYSQELLDAVTTENRKRQESTSQLAEDTASEMAEIMDYLLRATGTHPLPRIFVPGKDF